MSLKHSIDAEDASRLRTRQQLIEAAREVFAEAGFHKATIREICHRAGANIAAANYHFGGKEGLYAAAARDSLRSALEKYPPNFGLPPNPTPEDRLRAFVRSFLLRLLSEGPQAQHGKLMTRELVDPSPALDDIVKETVRPMATELMSIVRELLGPKADNNQVRRCGISIVSQIVFYHHGRPVLHRLFPKTKMDAKEIEKLARHISDFSLAALQKLAGKKSKTT